MTDSALRSLERAAAAGDTLAAARLVEAKIRAGGRDPRRDPQAGDLLSISSPRGWTYADGRPMAIVREVIRLLAKAGPGAYDTVVWRCLERPDRVRQNRSESRCSLAAWRRWARNARIVDPFEEDQDGRRPRETRTSCAPSPCERVRLCRYAPGYCWCGWHEDRHRPGLRSALHADAVQ